MSRVFWIGIGAAVGVLVVRRVTKAAHQYTPQGVAEGLTSFGDGLRELAGAVREGMAEREDELRFALGIDTESLPAERRPDGDAIRALLDDPSGTRARQG